MSGAIEISFNTTPGLPVQWAVFTFPDGSSGKLSVNRI
jgi:hypothetical protein